MEADAVDEIDRIEGMGDDIVGAGGEPARPRRRVGRAGQQRKARFRRAGGKSAQIPLRRGGGEQRRVEQNDLRRMIGYGGLGGGEIGRRHDLVMPTAAQQIAERVRIGSLAAVGANQQNPRSRLARCLVALFLVALSWRHMHDRLRFAAIRWMERGHSRRQILSAPYRPVSMRVITS